MTIETRSEAFAPPIHLSELPLGQRFLAYKERLAEQKDARKQLLEQGEKALEDGLRKLGVRAAGEDVLAQEYSSDDLKESYKINNLAMTYRHASIIDRFPDPVDSLAGTIFNEEAISMQKARLSFEASIEWWSDLPSFSKLILRGQIKNEKFTYRISQNLSNPDYPSRERRDGQIVTFSGNSSARFERSLDVFKETNIDSEEAKLSAALAFVDFVSRLTPQKV